MRTHLSPLQAALILLLVGSAILFLVGSTIERSHRHHESAAAKSAETSGGETGSGNESSGEGTNAEKHAASSSGEAGVKLLGINTESVALSVVAVVVSFLLAAAIWLRPSNLVFLAVAVFALVFAAGDARELVHQLDDSNGGLATVAGFLLFLHLGITALAASRLSRRVRERCPLPS